MRVRLPASVTRRLGAPLACTLARSWRLEVVRPEFWHQVRGSGRPVVIMSWHEALLPVLWHHRAQGISAIMSAGRDGQHLAAFARRIGYRIIPGSSSRGGARALLRAVRTLREGRVVGFTPDGPRGPRRVIKPGVLLAAQRGGGLVVPVHAEAHPAWRLASWDTMLIPKPFAKVRIAYGAPFFVEAGEQGRAAAEARARESLEEVTRLTAWPDGAAIPTG
jgi:lysophospholipid acyltransferase (LPLAT)-like uncharacterized protein